MSEYLRWNQKTITDFSDARINSLYNEGYVFTRLGKDIMDQTRSLRIDLSQFALSSENRRILRKTEDIALAVVPLPYADYHWEIGRMAKSFYGTKFGKGTFSANKVKELLTEPEKSNFNRLFVYSAPISVIPIEVRLRAKREAQDEAEADGLASVGMTKDAIGYTICLETNGIIHYSYPFYTLTPKNKDLGLGMMLRAILYAQKHGKQYMYLGSAQRPTDTYKLQFTGLEWFDGKKQQWRTDLDALKNDVKYGDTGIDMAEHANVKKMFWVYILLFVLLPLAFMTQTFLTDPATAPLVWESESGGDMFLFLGFLILGAFSYQYLGLKKNFPTSPAKALSLFLLPGINFVLLFLLHGAQSLIAALRSDGIIMFAGYTIFVLYTSPFILAEHKKKKHSWVTNIIPSLLIAALLLLFVFPVVRHDILRIAQTLPWPTLGVTLVSIYYIGMTIMSGVWYGRYAKH